MRPVSLVGFLCSLGLTVAQGEVKGHAFNKVLEVWLENQDFDEVIKSPALAPHLKQGILQTKFYGVTHPSQPNYLAAIAGDYFGNNHGELIEVPENISTIVDLFDTAGITWKGYMEGMPGPGYLGEGSTLVVGQGPERLGEGKWDYVRKHNPFVHFDSIAHNGLRLLNIQDLSVFWADAEAGNLPQYSFLTPNILNDGHDTTLEYAAIWTDAFLTRLYKCDLTDTLVILTYDESATYEKPNQIVTLLLGGAVPQQLKGTTDDMFYTHYSKIATLENNWDLPNLGRYDVGANVFQFVADKTGYKNVQLSAEDMALVDLSVSNGGFLNNGSQGQIWLAAPSPNLQLVGAGGKGVADVVKAHWESEADNLSPYSGDGKIWKVGYVPQAPAPVS